MKQSLAKEKEVPFRGLSGAETQVLAGAQMPRGLERAGSREARTSQVRKGGRTGHLNSIPTIGLVWH